MRRTVAVVAVSAVGILGFTACGDDDAVSQSEAEAELQAAFASMRDGLPCS